jgi:hypothetical protein
VALCSPLPLAAGLSMAMMMVTSPLTEDDPGETAFIDTFILILLYRPGHEVGR